MKERTLKPSEFLAWRKSMGWTQKQAAEALGVRENTVQQWETGRRYITPQTRAAMRLLDRLK